MTSTELLNTGIFYNFAKKHTEEDYSFEKDILQLIGSYQAFLSEAAIIGSNFYCNSIQLGQNHILAKELSFNEIKSFINHNIELY
ncbi:hypothetical protein [Marinifilum sp.]|uniref:hypothetical protein n=1 Tax=Marinifilum sp. TaxID=2033137 RepID=UPI003BAB2434